MGKINCIRKSNIIFFGINNMSKLKSVFWKIASILSVGNIIEVYAKKGEEI